MAQATRMTYLTSAIVAVLVLIFGLVAAGVFKTAEALVGQIVFGLII